MTLLILRILTALVFMGEGTAKDWALMYIAGILIFIVSLALFVGNLEGERR